MATNGEVISQGYWLCGISTCQQPNSVNLAPEKCSTCGHTREAYCKEAGTPKPHPAGMYSASSAMSDCSWMTEPLGPFPHVGRHHFSTHGRNSPSVMQHDDYYAPQSSYDGYPFTVCAGAGAPAQGSWVCAECGASNSALTSGFCPICGYKR